MTKEIFNQVRDDVMTGEMETGLTKLMNFMKDKSSRYEQEIILHLARVKELKKNSRMGIISHEDKTKTENQIMYAVLEMVEELENIYS